MAKGQIFINLKITKDGTEFYKGPVEITAVTRNMAAGGVTFSWVAANPDIDDWNPAIDEGDPATVGDRVAAEPLDDPEVVSAAFFGDQNSSSGTKGARIRITASGPDRDDLTWYVRWRVVGAALWGGSAEYGDTDPGPAVILETDFVTIDTDVEVQVAYKVGDGRISEWSAAATVVTGSVKWDSTAIKWDSTMITWDRT